MGQGKKTRATASWADAAYWGDEDEGKSGGFGRTTEVSQSSENVAKPTNKKSKDKKKGRELVDKRLSVGGFQLRREEADGAVASTSKEAPGGVEEQLWNAVQKGKGKIYRRAEEKVKVGTAMSPALVEMFAGSFSLDVVETVFESTGHDTEATVKALLGMATDAQPANLPPVADTSGDGASSSRAPEASGGPLVESPPTWDSLPEECKQLVLERLSPLDAARAARVCRDFAAFVRTLRAKTTALAIPAALTNIEHIMSFLRAFPNFTSLSFRKCRNTLPPPVRWSIFHRLHVQNDRPEGAKPIRSIDFGGITNVDSFDVHVLCQNRDLSHLDLSNTNIDDAALKGLARFPSLLPPLSFPSSQSAREDTLGLRSLNLAGCLWVTDAGLEPVVTRPETKRTLDVLDISKCISVTRGAVTHAAVRVLTAVGVTWERFVATHGPEKRLQELNLAQSTKLAEVSISSSHLVSLNLSGCSALTKLDLRCPNLETLKLAQCTALEEFGEIVCPALKKLSVLQCRQLTSEALSDVLAGAPLLEELNCSGCAALFRLDLAANSVLTKLDVSGCNRLGRLTIMSPALVVLNARGCSQLAELRADSEQVEELLLNNCRALRELHLRVLAALSTRREVGMEAQRLKIDARGCDSLPAPVLQWLIDISRKKSA